MVIFLIYILIINIIAFAVCGADKRRAIKQKRRISEKALLLLSVFGGAAGMLIAMLGFRHKTRKPKFVVLVPLLLAFWAALLLFLSVKFL